MGKGRPRAVQEGVLGQNSNANSCGALNIPSGPVYYPTEDEFKDPLEFIYKIRPEAEQFGICRIVPPKSWKPPFALDLNSFTFPTKTQAIHQLQARVAACDPKTFELEYTRFLEDHCGKKSRKRVVFEGEDLDFCRLFNAVKRYGGYDKVVKEKKWGEVFRFVCFVGKISECSKHVLCQLYREHLYDYEEYYNQLNKEKGKNGKRGMNGDRKDEHSFGFSCSKRRKGNQDCVAGSKLCKFETMDDRDQICEQCESGLHGEVMLLCDRCNRGWHIYCLSPPLKRIPPGNWYCLECLNSDKDSFGFVPGKCFSLEAFRKMADRAKKKWFGSASVSRMHIEKKFWEIVEGSVGEVEVMYGSDLDTSVFGSGFPRVNDLRPPSVELNEWEKYCASPWNLNNLPKLQGSMLRAVHHNIAGVMVPWLYVGMLFSSFCWHFEDHCFYSMNYLHWGEPKCWYSVPGSEASAFEKVMRNCLPDLFDAQPDLLFQLVTMLNPSVLQENGVSVYSVLQEPGNFVITFPRSFHGGLNCAEAVNFAPADWLPHGGFGAELYQLYRKAAVLSHEELLCVVAKGNCDSRVSPYLKKELLRIYSKEKTWRERLWRNGIVNSASMVERKHPEHVGTEEDPTCVICQQYLYLSAVVCCCRPSAFVCLEHWEHLCECSPSKCCLRYRHTLAELNELVLLTDQQDSEETAQCRNFRRQISCSGESSELTKKVKGGHVSLTQLAEDWLLSSCKMLRKSFSKDAYAEALKNAEQFLWAGSEMDPVRGMVKNLVEAQNWAESIRDCLFRVEKWTHLHQHNPEKVKLELVENLLAHNPMPCNEPGHLKLKEYAEAARLLVKEIESALSLHSKIDELEMLCSKVSNLPVFIKESERLTQRVSSLKACLDSIQKCISERNPAAIEINFLYNLKAEMLELQLHLPEGELLLALLEKAESFRSECTEMLNSSMTLKELEAYLQKMDNSTVDFPELKLLRLYQSDARLWISRFADIQINIHEREDQDSVIDELNCIFRDGESLKIQVDELPLVEMELKKASCRERGLKIEREKLFVDISGVLAATRCWEERAKHILSCEGHLSDFEDAIRSSEDIFVVLPSLNDVKDRVLMAKSWLENSKPFLVSTFSGSPESNSLLRVDTLQNLVSQSKSLKVFLEEKEMLENVLRNCKEWMDGAASVLHEAKSLLEMDDTATGMTEGSTRRIKQLITHMESVADAGLLLAFDFNEIPRLQDACSALNWCHKALAIRDVTPPLEEVQELLELEGHLFVTFACGAFWSSIVNGLKHVKKALEIVPMPGKLTKGKLCDAEELLLKLQSIEVPFPGVFGLLENAIKKHKLWQEQVELYSCLNSGEKTWSHLLQLKEVGETDAFKCPDLDMILSEVDMIENWKQKCGSIVGRFVGDILPLSSALSKIKQTLDNSLYIYKKLTSHEERDLCACCFTGSELQELIACTTCNCIGSEVANPFDTKVNTCSYCMFVKSGSVPRNEGYHLNSGGVRPELKMLSQLLSDATDFQVWFEERDLLEKVVEQALACKACLTEIVDSTLTFLDRDNRICFEKLPIALKATETAGVYDHQGSSRLEVALTRNSWRVRANKLLEGPKKPVIQHIQRHLKEGMAINVPQEDHFMQELLEVKQIGMQWADRAKKVAMDSGALELCKVFELIAEGENLPVHFEKELKLLRSRSELYCICRKPYDQRAMIACDKCDEWYHFDCINLHMPPKIYFCPACEPQTDEELSTSPLPNLEKSTGSMVGEPQTPSPRHRDPRRKLKAKSIDKKKRVSAKNFSTSVRCSSGIERLLWRNRKPFRRAAKKRVELESLSPFFDSQH
ncbi:JmjN domain [Dillenia turbinata]|uniref:JmjN domain n=1 Tax=Dillenia turbinata TaxID=194707 RepID=A0AAN8ZIL8_9MAGN